MKEKLFSLGYEKKSMGEYIDLLIDTNVGVVVDVRQTAWSYKKDFCKNSFSQFLSSNGITYVHVPQAGNPKEIRENSKSEDVLKNYRMYLEKTEAGMPELEEILTIARVKNQTVCFTCFEKDHRTCHRSVIIDFLQKKYMGRFDVVHLG